MISLPRSSGPPAQPSGAPHSGEGSLADRSESASLAPRILNLIGFAVHDLTLLSRRTDES